MRTISVVAFRDEESWKLGNGFLGSRAATGELAELDLDITDRDGLSVSDALATLGRRFARSEQAAASPPGFVEAHIEQGPILAAHDAPLDIVTSK